MRIWTVHLFLAQVGLRIGAILDFITEADMYLDSCDDSLLFFWHYREAPPGTWYLSIGCTGIYIYISITLYIYIYVLVVYPVYLLST